MGIQIPTSKHRATIGTGKIATRKQWLAEMARLPGLFIPLRTYSEANMRDNWDQVRRKKQQRDTVMLLGKSYTGSFVGKRPIRVKLKRYGPRLLDKGDNLEISFKAVRDEVAKMLGIDDGDEQSITFEYSQEKTRPSSYGIRIEIEEVKG